MGPSTLSRKDVIPQELADYMALQATACYLAYKENRPFLGFVDTPVSDWWAHKRIERYQAGYMKEVNRRARAKLYARTPIDFTALPAQYLRALASRFKKFKQEVLALNPGLHYNMREGYYWEGVEIQKVPANVSRRKLNWHRYTTGKQITPANQVVWPRL